MIRSGNHYEAISEMGVIMQHELSSGRPTAQVCPLSLELIVHFVGTLTGIWEGCQPDVHIFLNAWNHQSIQYQ